LAQLWKGRNAEEGPEKRAETVALFLFIVAVIAALVIAVMMGQHIAFPYG